MGDFTSSLPLSLSPRKFSRGLASIGEARLSSRHTLLGRSDDDDLDKLEWEDFLHSHPQLYPYVQCQPTMSSQPQCSISVFARSSRSSLPVIRSSLAHGLLYSGKMPRDLRSACSSSKFGSRYAWDVVLLLASVALLAGLSH